MQAFTVGWVKQKKFGEGQGGYKIKGFLGEWRCKDLKKNPEDTLLDIKAQKIKKYTKSRWQAPRVT